MESHRYLAKSLLLTVLAMLVLMSSFFLSRSESQLVKEPEKHNQLSSTFAKAYEEKLDELQKNLENELTNIGSNLTTYYSSKEIENTERAAIKRVIALNHIVISKLDRENGTWQLQKTLSPYDQTLELDLEPFFHSQAWATSPDSTSLIFSQPLLRNNSAESYLATHIFDRTELLTYLEDYLQQWLIENANPLLSAHQGIKIAPSQAPAIFQAWPQSESRPPDNTITLDSAFGSWEIILWYPHEKQTTYSKPILISGISIALLLFTLALNSYRKEREKRHAELTMNHFLTRIAHDLKTPMTNMMLGLDVAQIQLDSEHPETAKDRLGNLQIEIQRMNRLVENALDYSRGIRELTLTHCNISEAFTEMLQSFRLAFQQHNLKLNVSGLDPIIGTWQIPKEAIERIISNLLDNTRRHAQGATCVDVEFLIHQEQSLEISIKDDGKGFDSKLRDSLFDHATHNDLTIERGAGMGIKISQQLAQKAGGILTITDTTTGAHLHLTIPCKKITT